MVFDEAVSHLAPALQCEFIPVERLAQRVRDRALSEIREGLFDRHGVPRIVNLSQGFNNPAYSATFRIEGSDRLFSARVAMTNGVPVLECLGPTYVA